MVTVHAIDDGDEYMMFKKKKMLLLLIFFASIALLLMLFCAASSSTTYVFDGPVLRCEEGPVRALDEGHGGGGGGADVHGGGAAVAVAAALSAGAAVGPAAAALVAIGGLWVPVLALVVAAPDVDVGGDVGRSSADLLVAGLREKVYKRNIYINR